MRFPRSNQAPACLPAVLRTDKTDGADEPFVNRFTISREEQLADPDLALIMRRLCGAEPSGVVPDPPRPGPEFLQPVP